MKTRVLVIDDSPLMRSLLSQLIDQGQEMEVVGTAPDALTAREMIKSLNPDVLTLDVNMPKMDGLEFLERLMRLRPMPVVMVSSFTQAGSDTTLRALELGAVDFIGKPRAENERMLEEYAHELVEKIRVARNARLRPNVSGAVTPKQGPLPEKPVPPSRGADKIIFVGASTGGTEALKVFVEGLPPDCPPVLVVQHMPEGFTASFARRLDALGGPRVTEAHGGERVARGTVYIAPGHSHMTIRHVPGGFVTELHRTPPVNRHRPSVDVLFDSAAEAVGRRAIGIILTGMGKDGAQGLLRMRQAGAWTIGQDEASCVVYGMPREAFLIGAVAEQTAIENISGLVYHLGNTIT